MIFKTSIVLTSSSERNTRTKTKQIRSDDTMKFYNRNGIEVSREQAQEPLFDKHGKLLYTFKLKKGGRLGYYNTELNLNKYVR